MKVLLVLVVAVVGVAFANENLPLEEWRKQFGPYITECACAANTDPWLLNNIFDHGELDDSPCFKCALKCFCMKGNILTPGGKVNIDEWLKVAGMTEEIAEKCSQFDNVDLCQKAYDMIKCHFDELTAAGINTATFH